MQVKVSARSACMLLMLAEPCTGLEGYCRAAHLMHRIMAVSCAPDYGNMHRQWQHRTSWHCDIQHAPPSWPGIRQGAESRPVRRGEVLAEEKRRVMYAEFTDAHEVKMDEECLQGRTDRPHDDHMQQEAQRQLACKATP